MMDGIFWSFERDSRRLLAIYDDAFGNTPGEDFKGS